MTIEDLEKLGFSKRSHQFKDRPRNSYQSRNYYFDSDKGSLSVNYRRDTLTIGGCTGGRAFHVHLKDAEHLHIILDALLND